MKAWTLRTFVAVLLLTAGASGTAFAALVSRLGGQAVFDTDRNITWLSNANLAASNSFGVSGVEPDGRMHWPIANQWIAAMNASGHLGVTQWRLPVAIFPDANCSLDGSGNSDRAGFNCDQSEMGHLFYVELSGTAGQGTVITGDPTKLALFENIGFDGYFTGTPFAPDPVNQVWTFNFAPGNQDADDIPAGLLLAWPVVDGDVLAVVPLPSTVALLVPGLFGLFGLARRKRAR